PLRKYTLLALRAGRWSAAPFPLGIRPPGSPPRAPSGGVPGVPAVSSAPHHQRDAGRDDDRPEDAPQRSPPAEQPPAQQRPDPDRGLDRKSTRLNSSHASISYAVFCLK